ncbi:hypothetical protein, partial [uncultured Bacteroides sp.]|uniref:hypothetical protein n=1 Tax=uncultured Bacteroides sp. TaxID=162156 RepID=UPI00260E04D7
YIIIYNNILNSSSLSNRKCNFVIVSFVMLGTSNSPQGARCPAGHTPLSLAKEKKKSRKGRGILSS